MTGGEGILLSYRGKFVEAKDVVLEDAPQVGIISSERIIGSCGRSRGVRDICDGSSSKSLNDNVDNDVLRSAFVDGSYVPSPSSSFEVRIVVGTEGLVRFSREADPAVRRAVSSTDWLIGDVDSSRLIGTALGGDVNLERNLLAGGAEGGRA